MENRRQVMDQAISYTATTSTFSVPYQRGTLQTQAIQAVGSAYAEALVTASFVCSVAAHTGTNLVTGKLEPAIPTALSITMPHV